MLKRTRLLASPKSLGRWGEKRCLKFLKRKGLKLLVTNFSCKAGEIDLIMVDTDGSIVFVEVRTKRDESFQPPEVSITFAKRKRLLRAARYFLTGHNIRNRPFRFDIVTIVVNQASHPQIKHYQNAFVP